ncbi:hypothetical protein FF1_032959 [Malus domestica]
MQLQSPASSSLPLVKINIIMLLGGSNGPKDWKIELRSLDLSFSSVEILGQGGSEVAVVVPYSILAEPYFPNRANSPICALISHTVAALDPSPLQLYSVSIGPLATRSSSLAFAYVEIAA